MNNFDFTASRGEISALSDMELLTSLLSYLQPKEAEKIAFDALRICGSFEMILNATSRELAEAGFTPHTISFFRMLLPAYGRMIRAKFPKGYRMTTVDDIGQYCAACFCGVNVETVYMLLLRRDMGLIDCRQVAVGSVNSANLNTRALLEAALQLGAENIVLAHNHPNGNPHPSESDMNTTLSLKQAFDTVGINLVDHIIVSGNRFIPIMMAPHAVVREDENTL